MRFIALIIGNALALFLASSYIDGVSLKGGYAELAIAAVVIALINFLLKPGLRLVFGPFIILSLGLFAIVINMMILWLADSLLPQVEFKTTSALLLTTLLIGFINFVVSIGFKTHKNV
ncbi:phage holin family protein [Candidatus Azambacteria bacterium]|nr:phage holin family protein [Candidatus Azambacteria bacterium]